MKRFLVLICLGLAAAVTGCRKSEPSSPGATTPSTASTESAPAGGPGGAASGAVELKAQWPVGTKLTYRMDVERHVTMNIPQMPKPMQQDETSSMTTSLAILSERPGKGREVEFEFIAQESEFKMGDQFSMSFDSKSNPADDGNNPMAAIFRKLIGTKLKMHLDAEGSVQEIVGYDEWMDKLTQGPPGPGQMMIRQSFSQDFFKQMVETSKGLPAKPVKVGDTWPYKTEVGAGPMGRMALDISNKLVGVETRNSRRCAVVLMTGSFKSAGGAQAGPMGKVSLEGGTLKGTNWFALDLGTMAEGRLAQTMKMKVEMPGAPAGGQSMNGDINQKMTIQLVEVGKIK